MSPSEFRIRHGVTTAVLAVSVCAAGAACGSGDDSGGSTPSSNPARTADGSIDACALISADEITSLMGTAIVGEATGDNPEMPGCIWENIDTFESVSVEIGTPNTAIDGALPPPDTAFGEATRPGPDGMRFVGNGVVEFAADTRSNTVQVAVNTLRGEDADDAAVDLARQISAQLNR
ncbi:hypothetical protein [Mycolicibacterium gilvum]|uniref:hypothetical protein n=1 Tax=Mycolicibacterium gilvum TaxID=1804 RepID=UPI004046684F